MATISNTLSLEDNMTSTLTNIQRAAIDNIQTFNDMSKEVENLKKSLEEAESINPEIVGTDMYADAAEGLEAMENKLYDVASGEDEFEETTQKTKLSITDLNQALELCNKAWSAFNSVIQEANGWMETNNNQFNAEYTAAMKMHSILGANEDEINSMYDYAAALQQVGVVGDEATISGMSRLTQYADNIEQVKQLTPALLDLTVAQNGLNTSQQSVESTMQQVGRALETSSSRLAMQGIITKEQSKHLDSLQSKEQKVAYMTQILEERYGGANEALAQTAQGGIMQADNALGDLQETLGEKVTPYFTEFKQLLVKVLTPAIQFLADNMNWLAPIFITLAVVIGIVIIVLTIYAAINAVVALSELDIFWPLLLIIGAIIAIIAIITSIVSIVNKVTGSTISAVGVIMGIIYTLVAFIKNVFIAPVYNKIAMLVNFLANCFKDPITSIKILFLEMAEHALDTIRNLLQGIEDLINKIPGVEIDITSGIEGVTNDIKDKVSNLKEDMQWEDVMGYMEQEDYGEAYNKGYDFGSGIENDLNNFSLQNEVDKISLDDLAGTDGAGGKALKTTSEDEVKIADEDIQLLLDISTRDYKLNYQQVTPQVSVNFGDVRETADVDGVMDEVATRLEEIYDGNLST